MKPRRRAKAKYLFPAVPIRGRVSVPTRLKYLDRTQRHAVLATLSVRGPHGCLIAFVLTKDGKNIVFATPVKTAKHRNMIRDSRVSLLIDSRKNSCRDYLDAEAVTVFGRAREIKEGKRWAELATLLVSKHPELQSFVATPMTALMLVTITRCVHVGKFQSVSVWTPPRGCSSHRVCARRHS
jgi:nitroimidazol reductase NimA-like FMN-containing flavoprotein (pyridoxamine 5'-phosphate oxidase superfamily)